MANNVHSSASLDSAFAARFPSAGESGVIASLAASGEDGKFDLGFCKYDPEAAIASLEASSAEPGQVSSLEAMGVRGFASVSGKLLWIRTTQHIHVKFEFIGEGEYVQLPEEDAKRLIASGRAVEVSDEEVAKAQKAAK